MSKSATMRKVVISSALATGIFLASPQDADAALGDQTLRKGMNHPDVKDLQDALKAKGFFTFDQSTGYYGPITEDAVRKFQREHRLQVDGIAGPQTLSTLLALMDQQTQVQAQRMQTAQVTTTLSTTSSSTQSALTTTSVLRFGSRGKQVEELQLRLKQEGHFNHEVTGYFGRITTDAVKAYQRKHKLKVDGIVGPQTLSSLLNVNQPNTNSTLKVSTPSTGQVAVLRNGSKGNQVRTLQQQLKDLGFYSHSVTGNFGGITELAVRDFQRARKIKVDGFVGPQTRAELEKALAERSTGKAPAATPVTTTPAPAPAPSTSLTIGVRSDAVTELQSQLRSLGLFNVQPTGYYGEITAQSVREFQRLNNIKVTGVADQATIAKIKEVATNKASESTSELPSRGSTSPAAMVTNMVADAATFIGTPYVWGGTTASGFDCSGFVQTVFSRQGVTIPRTVALQWNFGKAVSQPAVGDVVFFETVTGPSHNGIYIGNNQFIHSGSSTGVIIANMNSTYWKERYLGAKRMY
ncbi:C40 family peptidase [Alkalihalobacterium bogoriense]|uniref:C40 family peptidase n=1 Tax=Alkalihalobacterium bogoriense TaxID=246272 RepID=UPI000687E440|nr:peptidoglycan-binding protein [Alkalihalobacterium bogoriense]